MRDNGEVSDSHEPALGMLTTTSPGTSDNSKDNEVMKGSSGSESGDTQLRSTRAVYFKSETSWDQCLARTGPSNINFTKSCEWEPKVLNVTSFPETTSQWKQVNTLMVPGFEVETVMSPMSTRLVESTAHSPVISPGVVKHPDPFKDRAGVSVIRNGNLQEVERTCTTLGVDQQQSTSSISKLRAFMFQPKFTAGIETQATNVHKSLTAGTALTRPDDLNLDYLDNESKLDSYEEASSNNFGRHNHTPKSVPGIGSHSDFPTMPISAPVFVQESRHMESLKKDPTATDMRDNALYTSAEDKNTARYGIPSVIIQVANNLALSTHNGHVLDTDQEFLSRTLTESDHEFSVADNEEQQMLQLTDIQERFSPPSSLQLPFDNSAQSPEVYDSNLKGSPPEVGDRSTADNHASKYFFHPKTGLDSALSDANGVNTSPMGNQMECDPDSRKDEWGFLHNASPQHTVAQSLSPSVIGIDANGIPVPMDRFAGSNSPTHGRMQSVLDCDDSGRPKPFARSPFPAAVQDRPFIPGLSSATRLRTCFRIGEAIRESSMATRCRRHNFIELYARVLYASREEEGFKQTFQFGDLFHDRGPFLNGVCTSWKNSKVWDDDTKGFLGDHGNNKMARVTGKIERCGSWWLMDVLSIWEASWDDVAHVKGIVCS